MYAFEVRRAREVGGLDGLGREEARGGGDLALVVTEARPAEEKGFAAIGFSTVSNESRRSWEAIRTERTALRCARHPSQHRRSERAPKVPSFQSNRRRTQKPKTMHKQRIICIPGIYINSHIISVVRLLEGASRCGSLS
jgi:hypothetical protein